MLSLKTHPYYTISLLLMIARVTMGQSGRGRGERGTQASCSGPVATGVIVTALLFVGFSAVWWYFLKRKRKTGMKTDPESAKKAAYDNPQFQMDDYHIEEENGDVLNDTSSSLRVTPTSKGSGKCSPTVSKNAMTNIGSTLERSKITLEKVMSVVARGGSKLDMARKSKDDSCVMESKDIIVPLEGHDFTGLGFNIQGNLKEGMFVKDVMSRGPATESGQVATGDRIIALTVLTDHIVYKDAQAILSYASPYPVLLHLRKSPIKQQAGGMTSSQGFNHSQSFVSKGKLTEQMTSSPWASLIHPSFRSPSHEDLTKMGESKTKNAKNFGGKTSVKPKTSSSSGESSKSPSNSHKKGFERNHSERPIDVPDAVLKNKPVQTQNKEDKCKKVKKVDVEIHKSGSPYVHNGESKRDSEASSESKVESSNPTESSANIDSKNKEKNKKDDSKTKFGVKVFPDLALSKVNLKAIESADKKVESTEQSSSNDQELTETDINKTSKTNGSSGKSKQNTTQTEITDKPTSQYQENRPSISNDYSRPTENEENCLNTEMSNVQTVIPSSSKCDDIETEQELQNEMIENKLEKSSKIDKPRDKSSSESEHKSNKNIAIPKITNITTKSADGKPVTTKTSNNEKNKPREETEKVNKVIKKNFEDPKSSKFSSKCEPPILVTPFNDPQKSGANTTNEKQSETVTPATEIDENTSIKTQMGDTTNEKLTKTSEGPVNIGIPKASTEEYNSKDFQKDVNNEHENERQNNDNGEWSENKITHSEHDSNNKPSNRLNPSKTDEHNSTDGNNDAKEHPSVNAEKRPSVNVEKRPSVNAEKRPSVNAENNTVGNADIQISKFSVSDKNGKESYQPLYPTTLSHFSTPDSSHSKYETNESKQSEQVKEMDNDKGTEASYRDGEKDISDHGTILYENKIKPPEMDINKPESNIVKHDEDMQSPITIEDIKLNAKNTASESANKKLPNKSMTENNSVNNSTEFEEYNMNLIEETKYIFKSEFNCTINNPEEMKNIRDEKEINEIRETENKITEENGKERVEIHGSNKEILEEVVAIGTENSNSGSSNHFIGTDSNENKANSSHHDTTKINEKSWTVYASNEECIPSSGARNKSHLKSEFSNTNGKDLTANTDGNEIVLLDTQPHVNDHCLPDELKVVCKEEMQSKGSSRKASTNIFNEKQVNIPIPKKREVFEGVLAIGNQSSQPDTISEQNPKENNAVFDLNITDSVKEKRYEYRLKNLDLPSTSYENKNNSSLCEIHNNQSDEMKSIQMSATTSNADSEDQPKSIQMSAITSNADCEDQSKSIQMSATNSNADSEDQSPLEENSSDELDYEKPIQIPRISVPTLKTIFLNSCKEQNSPQSNLNHENEIGKKNEPDRTKKTNENSKIPRIKVSKLKEKFNSNIKTTSEECPVDGTPKGSAGSNVHAYAHKFVHPNNKKCAKSDHVRDFEIPTLNKHFKSPQIYTASSDNDTCMQEENKHLYRRQKASNMSSIMDRYSKAIEEPSTTSHVHDNESDDDSKSRNRILLSQEIPRVTLTKNGVENKVNLRLTKPIKEDNIKDKRGKDSFGSTFGFQGFRDWKENGELKNGELNQAQNEQLSSHISGPSQLPEIDYDLDIEPRTNNDLETGYYSHENERKINEDYSKEHVTIKNSTRQEIKKDKKETDEIGVKTGKTKDVYDTTNDNKNNCEPTVNGEIIPKMRDGKNDIKPQNIEYESQNLDQGKDNLSSPSSQDTSDKILTLVDRINHDSVTKNKDSHVTIIRNDSTEISTNQPMHNTSIHSNENVILTRSCSSLESVEDDITSKKSTVQEKETILNTQKNHLNDQMTNVCKTWWTNIDTAENTHENCGNNISISNGLISLDVSGKQRSLTDSEEVKRRATSLGDLSKLHEKPLSINLLERAVSLEMKNDGEKTKFCSFPQHASSKTSIDEIEGNNPYLPGDFNLKRTSIKSANKWGTLEEAMYVDNEVNRHTHLQAVVSAPHLNQKPTIEDIKLNNVGSSVSNIEISGELGSLVTEVSVENDNWNTNKILPLQPVGEPTSRQDIGATISIPERNLINADKNIVVIGSNEQYSGKSSDTSLNLNHKYWPKSHSDKNAMDPRMDYHKSSLISNSDYDLSSEKHQKNDGVTIMTITDDTTFEDSRSIGDLNHEFVDEKSNSENLKRTRALSNELMEPSTFISIPDEHAEANYSYETTENDEFETPDSSPQKSMTQITLKGNGYTVTDGNMSKTVIISNPNQNFPNCLL